MTTPMNILITGATAGIGRHAALHLARAGHRVFASGRRQDALDSLVAQAEGTALETLRLDVTDPDAIASAWQRIRERTGGYGVDALVNNAGYAQLGPLETIDSDPLRRQFETNVFGLMAVTRAVLPEMHRRGSGRIVNVSSIAGLVSMPLMGAYNASKYAVEGMSDALRNELRPFGIRVVLVEPGPIRSDFADASMSGLAELGLEKTVYAPVARRSDDVMRRFKSQEAAPVVVTRAIEKALTHPRPRARYVVPWRAQVMLSLMRRLPTSFIDAIMIRFTNLSSLRLPKPPSRQLPGATH